MESLRTQLQGAQIQGYTPEMVAEAMKFNTGANVDLESLSLSVAEIFHNSPPAVLYQQALKFEKGSAIVSSGALAVKSGKKTGRSPLDKRIVRELESEDHVWWGPVNFEQTNKSFITNRERAIDYLNVQKRLYVIDGFAGWDKRYRIPVRVITSRPYHALFMQNMLVEPMPDELEHFEITPQKKPFVIYNAGTFPANRRTDCMTSSTSVSVSFERNEMVILGTQYAGEMKKGVFTIMNYYMPLEPNPLLPAVDRCLPLHASANIGPDNDVTIFFGLSGTGKTTLSADPKRDLIGDDEHVWTTEGVFNIEGGCYAKCVGLTREKEPEIYDAIRFGSVLENVVFEDVSRVVDYDDTSLTENTRVAYPLKFIANARIPATVPHQPKNVILLTCDAFGVLPPLSKLNAAQVMYHFISGYTAKVAGTEDGIDEPVATFSPCFGGPFLVHHPYVYAEMLAAKLEAQGATAYLVNTGWVGGGYGEGERCSLKYTRKIIDMIHDGSLKELPDDEWIEMPVFRLKVPKNSVGDIPINVLQPHLAWETAGLDHFSESVDRLAKLFSKNFTNYADRCTRAVVAAGPSV